MVDLLASCVFFLANLLSPLKSYKNNLRHFPSFSRFRFTSSSSTNDKYDCDFIEKSTLISMPKSLHNHSSLVHSLIKWNDESNYLFEAVLSSQVRENS